MNCPRCGFDGPPGMGFCGMCGAILPSVCPDCGFGNPPGFRYCGMCGVQLPVACPECGSVYPADHRYCGTCGSRTVQETGRDAGHAALTGTAGASSVEPSSQEEGTASRLLLGSRRPPLSHSSLAQLEGERRHATVILADVLRSTDLMEQIGTEAWVEIMNHVFQILENDIYRFGGEVDQFRGDGLVAFFGTSLAHEDDPERAVLAALAMQSSIKLYAADLAEHRDIELSLRVGVNTGEVIVASIGDRSHYSEDTAMGGAVALAARMETAAEPGTVLVTESTYRLVRSQFEWEDLGEISVKGISQPLAVFRPLAPKADVSRSLRLETYGLPSLLIGRDEQGEALKSCLGQVRAGRGSVVLLTGNEGMGKSHLAAHVRQQDLRDLALLAKTQGSDDPKQVFPMLTWLQGRCRSYEQSRPYSMWIDLLQSWLGMHGGEPKPEMCDLLYRESEQLWGTRENEYSPYLATLLSLPLDEALAERIRRLDAEGLHQQFLVALRSWAMAMARRTPLVLTFEDVHWADASSLEMLEYCLTLCEQEPLLCAVMFRLDHNPRLKEFHDRVRARYSQRLTELQLAPLDEEQSREMIDRLIGPQALPQKTRVLILKKAEGNPYYIEELIESLIMQGVLVREPDTTGEWRATRTVTSLDLPDTLRGLLSARMDDLSLGERQTLQMASVIGSVFWSNVLQELVEDRASLNERLMALQRAQLIAECRHLPALGTEYVFQSTLIRDAAYESLLSAQRAVYHLQVAERLEDFFGLGALPRYYDLLAYHYRCAGDANKELFYAVQAAEQARQIYSNTEALGHYTRALELLDATEAQTEDEDRLYAIRAQQFEVLNGRSQVLFWMGDEEAGWTDARALLPLAQRLADDPAWLIDALLSQPGVARWQSQDELEAGIPLAEQALDLARKLGDQRREMQSLLSIAGQRIRLNDPDARDYAEQALELSRQLGDQRYEVNILISIGRVLAWDEPERSMEYLEAALPICQALEDKMTELNLLDLIGMQYERNGDYHRLLLECHQKKLAISREIGYYVRESISLTSCGEAQGVFLGDYEAAWEMLETSRKRQEGDTGELFVLLRMIQILTAQGEAERALQILERARRICGLTVWDIGHVGLALVSASLYCALDDPAHLHEVLRCADEARRLVREKPMLSRQYVMAADCEASAAHLGLAEHAVDELEAEVHRQNALSASRAALDLCQSLGGVQIIECLSEEILFRHANALAATGSQEEALEYLQMAYDEMMRKHGLIPPSSPFRRTYLENIPLHRAIRAAHAAQALPEPDTE